MLAINIGGIEVPDAGPVFLGALGIHVVAGSISVIAGALASFARKRPGRHPMAGRVFFAGLATVFATATVMAIIRWRQDRHLFLIAAIAFGLAMTGLIAKRRQRRHWMRWHGAAMGGAYIALFTGFYVDNGPQLPVWDRLPHLTYWLLPAAIGIPLILLALYRNGALRRTGHAGGSRLGSRR